MGLYIVGMSKAAQEFAIDCTDENAQAAFFEAVGSDARIFQRPPGQLEGQALARVQC
ncbi:hypothetical protein UNDYM_3621 [Undibacterium sp. YM2]|nr:hypothetical protein UNDYM_3621 [Undibacterium sp. YM2]